MKSNISPKYNHLQVETKWQNFWREKNIYRTDNNEQAKEKFYILDMFPYPSGAGLHVGHPKGYIATDILARTKRMQGFNVLHPMGWDAFGLPAENHALKTGEAPRIATKRNIDVFKRQMDSLGLGYDWDREVNTTDPEFYKWTQWCFLKMWGTYYDEKKKCARPIEEFIAEELGEKRDYYDLEPELRKVVDDQRLAFESWAPINWCPSCQTGLANEDLEDGVCERCGSEIERKPMRQWVIRITKYAERLLNDLSTLSEWEDFIKTMQTHWIGRSEGVEVKFEVVGDDGGGAISAGAEIAVFTTRVDTLYGCTYIVLAPEHPLISKLLNEEKSINSIENESQNTAANDENKINISGLNIKNKKVVSDYITEIKKKSVLERTDLNKDKSGVKVDGLMVINPINGEKVAVWVADYVLGDYGTGAVMAVPAHDERDFVFAQKYGLEVRQVVAMIADEKSENGNETEQMMDIGQEENLYTKDGILIDSAEFSGLHSAEARVAFTQKLAEEKVATKKVNYKIKDWVFSRQRYWGEPIPMIHCQKCGLVPVEENNLPVVLPEVEKYQPTGTGESPLADIESWINTTCPRCGETAKRESNTMPQWAGSSWYYLRFCDAQNNDELINKEVEKYWNPVDFYVGGAEHATRHLIYARFWHKFLYDLGFVGQIEPFVKLRNQGLILAEDGRKMSKRWGNVINPDEVVNEFGADAMRIYEMFMSPFNQACAWNTQGVVGVRKFLDRVWNLQAKVVVDGQNSKEKYEVLLEKTIRQVGQNIADFKFNTAVSAMMILVNKWAESEVEVIDQNDFTRFVLVLSPFAPHFAEELWRNLGYTESIVLESWPQIDEQILAGAELKIMIQVGGKLRGELIVSPELAMDKDEILSQAKKTLIDNGKLIAEAVILKEIYVPGKIVNLVISANK